MSGRSIGRKNLELLAAAVRAMLHVDVETCLSKRARIGI